MAPDRPPGPDVHAELALAFLAFMIGVAVRWGGLGLSRWFR